METIHLSWPLKTPCASRSVPREKVTQAKHPLTTHGHSYCFGAVSGSCAVLRLDRQWHPFFRSQIEIGNRIVDIVPPLACRRRLSRRPLQANVGAPYGASSNRVRACALETDSTLRGQLLNPGLPTTRLMVTRLFSPKNYWAILLLSFTPCQLLLILSAFQTAAPPRPSWKNEPACGGIRSTVVARLLRRRTATCLVPFQSC